MNFIHSIRQKTGIVLLISCALLSNLRLLYRQVKSFDISTVGKDRISLKDKQYEELRKILPSYGVVGYISDWSPSYESFKASTEYTATQYCLAPVVVENTHERELVVGNFRSGGSIARRASPRKLVLVKDFINGIILYRGERK